MSETYVAFSFYRLDGRILTIGEVFELFLDTFFAKLGLFDHSDLFFIFKGSVLIFRRNMERLWIRGVRRWHSMLDERLPIEACEPRMFHQLGGSTLETESITRVSL